MPLQFDGPLVLAGAGKMGAALVEGWLARGAKPQQIIVQEPSLAPDIEKLVRTHQIDVRPRIEQLDAQPAVIVVAVKPQVMSDVFPGIAKLAGPQTVVMSIAAGKSIASFEQHLPEGVAVVRAMPNTPAAIGRGVTGAVGNAHLKPQQRALCDELLKAVGEVVWLQDEAQIDAVTAVSGSGPAYVFLLAEAMAQAGIAEGLDPETAMKLARATVAGAGELLHQSPVDAGTLRQNVTSPGGTTAAALAVLMRGQGGLAQLMSEAISAAKKRSRELGS